MYNPIGVICCLRRKFVRELKFRDGLNINSNEELENKFRKTGGITGINPVWS